ncbi:MAG: EamA family transporter [Acidimicrobiales bacterium]
MGAGLVLFAALFIQWSAALVRPSFALIGPAASSSWRFAFGALMLLAIARPNVRRFTRHQWIGALVFGTAVAIMNLSFYEAIARIPLGSAVVIEFLGPLLVAALGKRTWRHAGFVLLAAGGVIVLSHPGGGLTTSGVFFALGAGAGWATYLFAARRVGGSTNGLEGLAVGITVSALWSLPFTLLSAHVVVAHPYVIGRLVLVALMALVLGFGAELSALRRLKPSVVGVLVAFDPVIAFVVGWILLGQRVSVWEYVGVACVVFASVGVTRDSSRELLEVAQ